MNPQPLRITQPIILRLDLRKQNRPRLRIPQKQIRNPATTLLILLRQNLADSRERLAPETLHDLHQIV